VEVNCFVISAEKLIEKGISQNIEEYFVAFEFKIDESVNKRVLWVDLKVLIAGEITTYKKQLNFFIVNKK
jgi:hypothetical protein